MPQTLATGEEWFLQGSMSASTTEASTVGLGWGDRQAGLPMKEPVCLHLVGGYSECISLQERQEAKRSWKGGHLISRGTKRAPGGLGHQLIKAPGKFTDGETAV